MRTTRWCAIAVSAVALCVMPWTSMAAVAVRAVPSPLVTGPVTAPATWGVFHNQSFFSVAPYGFTDEEFFVEGTAKAYAVSAPDAAYKTRIQVIRPDAQHFNGTVVVEWLNTSTGQDLAGEWLQMHESILRDGYAWVGVSAQSESTSSLAAWDPARYGTLHNPGYWHMFDIYNQAIQSLRATTGVKPLGTLVPQRLLATGVSQSAVRLDEYLDFGVDQDVQLVDGFLIERNVDTKTDYGSPRVPVINIATEESTQPLTVTSGPKWRMWQVAGGAHIDHYFVEFWRAQLQNNNQDHAPARAGADTTLAAQVGTYGERSATTGAVCGTDGDMYPSRYVSMNALFQLNRWVSGGAAAVQAPAIATHAPVGPAGSTISRDAIGNAIGGYRLPVVDVPVVAYIGTTCGLSGQTLDAAPGTLATRYPTKASYLSALRTSIDTAVADGRLLTPDADDLWQRAQGAVVPR
jgi:hypothetical protein